MHVDSQFSHLFSYFGRSHSELSLLSLQEKNLFYRKKLSTFAADFMKILQLGKFYPIQGGVEKVMYDLLTGLAAEGVQCDMLCANEDKGVLLQDPAEEVCHDDFAADGYHAEADCPRV